jgi:hypothetical protein
MYQGSLTAVICFNDQQKQAEFTTKESCSLLPDLRLTVCRMDLIGGGGGVPDNVLITCLSLAADWGGPAGVQPVIADTKEEEEEVEEWLLAFFVCFIKTRTKHRKQSLLFALNLTDHSQI